MFLSLGGQIFLWQVRKRCKNEWKMFQDRVLKAEKNCYKSVGVENLVHEVNWATDDGIKFAAKAYQLKHRILLKPHTCLPYIDIH
ncbi:hypothetical protein L1987_62064 [Smallanthus sonchifolius]|uniref:Uncharacterized protein n=1 Tax=Smallanthus sonchifolius TaxID=185202 RepID=A0ACB9C9F8_9ASTR|nr:hypothetical protein L1987_62064 [Smallanthus sonchifolius]